MSNAILLPPGKNIIDEIAVRLRGEEKDYSRSAVVFPGKRPAHYLRKKLAELTESAYIPPRIFSMDEFINYIYVYILRHNHRMIDDTDAAALLYRIHSETEAPIGGDAFRRTDDFLPLALEVFRELEEFCMAGISPRDLKEAVSGYDKGQVGGVERYYSAFYNTIKNLGYSTRSSRYLTVARAINDVDIPEFDQLIFGGFFLLTTAEKDILRCLLPRGNTILLFQEGKGITEHLRGMNIPVEVSVETPAEPEVVMIKSPDTHGQVFALAELLRREKEAGVIPDEKSVIVTPAAETLFPLIEQVLPVTEDAPFNISLGYPFTRSTVYGFLNSLTDMVISRENGRFYAPDYLRFVLHPFTKNIMIDGSPEPSRIIFHALEDHFIGSPHLNFFAMEDIENDDKLADQIEKRLTGAGYNLSAADIRGHLRAVNENTIRPMEKIESIADMARKCALILTYINGRSTAKRHPLFSHFAGHFIKSLTALESSLIAPLKFEEQKAYFNFFRRFAGGITVPFAGTPLSGLQVLGFLETRSLKFDTVYFLDTNDDVISGLKRDEPLIPNSIRVQLGIPVYRDREKLNAYYLDVLVRNARKAVFFYIEKDKKEKSRYLEQYLWEKEKEGKKQAVRSVQYKVRLSNPEPEAIAKTPEIISILNRMKFSATALDTYLRCQLRFYYRSVMKLREREEPEEDIDYLRIGTIVHEILRRYFTPLKGETLTSGNLESDKMELTISDVFRDEYGGRISGKAYLLQIQIRRRMEDFLRNYQRPSAKEHEIRIVDAETLLESRFHGFTLFGKIDRIEKRDNGIFIVDYKISSNADRLRINYGKLVPDIRSSWNKAVGSLQLPVYAHIFADHFREPVENINPIFLLLGKQKIDKEAEQSLFDEKAGGRPEQLSKVDAVLRGILEEIADPATLFHPAEDLAAECPACPYKTICGTLWTKSGHSDRF